MEMQQSKIALLLVLCVFCANVTSPPTSPAASTAAGGSHLQHDPSNMEDTATRPSERTFFRPTDLMLSINCSLRDCLPKCCDMRADLKIRRRDQCEQHAANQQQQPQLPIRQFLNFPKLDGLAFVVLDDSLCSPYQRVLPANQAQNVDDLCTDFLVDGRRLQPWFCDPLNVLPKVTGLKVYHSVMCVSTAFLIFTLGLYSAIPKLRRKVHHKCFLCYLIFLIFACMSACSMLFLPHYMHAFAGYLVHFGMLGSYFWLNTICIDVLRTICVLKSEKQSGKTFMLYTLYALGCPMVLSTVTLLADHYLPPNYSWKPGINKNGWFDDYDCGFSWLNPSFIFYHNFVYLTLAINVYAFSRTALRIEKENKRWTKNEDEGSYRHKKQQARFSLYLKLFLLMGLYNIGSPTSYYWNATESIRIVFIIINALHGVFIFILFVCNKQVIELIKERFFS